MFHSGGDTSSNCQVSDYVDKSCALVALLDLYVNSENSLGERSSLARLAVRAMRAAFSMPRGAPRSRVPEQGSMEPVSVVLRRRCQRRR